MNSFGIEIFDDPELKTSIKNYEFKYVPTTQFQKVIKTVQKDRFNQHKKQLWDQKVDEGSSSPKCSSNKKNFRTKGSSFKVLNDSKFKNINYTPNTCKSLRPSKVPTMSDTEIDKVIESAIHEVIPGSTEHIKFDPSLDLDDLNDRPEMLSVENIEEKKPIDKSDLNRSTLNKNLNLVSSDEDNNDENVADDAGKENETNNLNSCFDENKGIDSNTEEEIVESINLAELIETSRSKKHSGRSSKTSTKRSSKPETPRSIRRTFDLESNLVTDSVRSANYESLLNNKFMNDKFLNDSENDEIDNHLIARQVKSNDLILSDADNEVEKKISTQIEKVVTDDDDDLVAYNSCDEKAITQDLKKNKTELRSEIEESDAENFNAGNSTQNYLEKILNLRAFNKNLEQISNDNTTTDDEYSDRKTSDLDKPPFPRIEIRSRNNEGDPNEVPLATAPINLFDLYSKAKLGESPTTDALTARSIVSLRHKKNDKSKKKSNISKNEILESSDENNKSDDEKDKEFENQKLEEHKKGNGKDNNDKNYNLVAKENFEDKKKPEMKNNTKKNVQNEKMVLLSSRSASPVKTPCSKKSLDGSQHSSNTHLAIKDILPRQNIGATPRKNLKLCDKPPRKEGYNPLGSSNFAQKSPRVQKPLVNTSRQILESLTKGMDPIKTPRGICLTEDAKVTDAESATNIMLIFSKVTAYQEKINYLLEKLRHDVLATTPPDSFFEKRRRERNVIEFSARFARNYLYQLERLIEEIRICPLSVKGNHRAYIKVCGLYGLLYQALQSYLKQLKYFLLDKKPRKLDILLRLVLKGTEVCILRHFFAKDDAIIMVMINLCREILELCFEPEQPEAKPSVTESLEKKIPKVTRLDTYRQQNKLSMYDSKPLLTERKKNRKLGSTSSKLSLRQSTTRVERVDSKPQNALERRLQTFLDCGQNEKLAQKEKEREEREKRRHTRRESSPSEFKMETVDTLVEKCDNADSAVDIACSSGDTARQSRKTVPKPSNKPKPVPKLNENQPSLDDFIETLQTITKKEIQQILSPLITHLGALLTEASPLNINEILNKFNTQVLNLTESTMSTNLAANSKKSLLLSETLKSTEEITESILVPEPSIILRELNMPDDVIIPNSQKDIRNMNCGDTWNNRGNNEINAQEKKSELVITGSVEIKTDQEEFKDVVQEHFITNTDDVIGHYLYDRNIQYTFINKLEDEMETLQLKECNSSKGMLNEHFAGGNKNENINAEEDIFSDVNEEPDKPQADYLHNLNGMFLNRIDFIEQISENPLYVNENFSEPWKIVTKISSDILTELLADIETGINFGEANYVSQFLDTELSY